MQNFRPKIVLLANYRMEVGRSLEAKGNSSSIAVGPEVYVNSTENANNGSSSASISSSTATIRHSNENSPASTVRFLVPIPEHNLSVAGPRQSIPR